MTKQEYLYAWLEHNPYILVSAVCKDAGYNHGNFVRAKKKGYNVPDEVLDRMAKCLKKYGFVEQKKK